jgi:integrase
LPFGARAAPRPAYGSPVRNGNLWRRERRPTLRSGREEFEPGGAQVGKHRPPHGSLTAAIEHGRPIYWLSKHLGHSSLDVTDRVYGHMEAATRQREAREVAGVFGV